jgi:hypothetical protein
VNHRFTGQLVAFLQGFDRYTVALADAVERLSLTHGVIQRRAFFALFLGLTAGFGTVAFDAFGDDGFTCDATPNFSISFRRS